jgi:hypothetical protein
MKPETLVAQIETYSNAIVAFAVLQGLAYSYAFGTNAFFNCLVKTSNYLAEGLTLLFVLVMLLSIAAMVALGRTVARIAGEFRSTVRKLYLGKTIAVVIFSLVPVAITFGYGVRDYPNKAECKKITTPA